MDGQSSREIRSFNITNWNVEVFGAINDGQIINKAQSSYPKLRVSSRKQWTGFQEISEEFKLHSSDKVISLDRLNYFP
jgi:hypothetical protein